MRFHIMQKKINQSTEEYRAFFETDSIDEAKEAGADFNKTSTRKVSVNATPEAATVMCKAIKEYYEKTGRKVGFKAAGGVSNADEALQYYEIGQSILGDEWMNKELFRFGVSRLGNSLVSAIENTEVKFFPT